MLQRRCLHCDRKLLCTRSARMRKIAIVGPESSGKDRALQSARCALATHHGWRARAVTSRIRTAAMWKPMLARHRQSAARHHRDLREEPRVGPAHGTARTSPPRHDPTGPNMPVRYPELPLLLCDTDAITVRIWSEEKFGRCDPRWSSSPRNGRTTGHWLLCRPDIPWEPDQLREPKTTAIASSTCTSACSATCPNRSA